MSTDLENITASFGLVRREFKDVHAVVSRLDTQVRRLAEPRARPRPGGAARRVSPDRPQGKAAARGRLPAAFRRRPGPGEPDRAQRCGDAGADDCCDLGCRARRMSVVEEETDSTFHNIALTNQLGD
jgi:hypothetical protein